MRAGDGAGVHRRLAPGDRRRGRHPGGPRLRLPPAVGGVGRAALQRADPVHGEHGGGDDRDGTPAAGGGDPGSAGRGRRRGRLRAGPARGLPGQHAADPGPVPGRPAGPAPLPRERDAGRRAGRGRSAGEGPRRRRGSSRPPSGHRRRPGSRRRPRQDGRWRFAARGLHPEPRGAPARRPGPGARPAGADGGRLRARPARAAGLSVGDAGRSRSPGHGELRPGAPVVAPGALPGAGGLAPGGPAPPDHDLHRRALPAAGRDRGGRRRHLPPGPAGDRDRAAQGRLRGQRLTRPQDAALADPDVRRDARAGASP